MNTLQIEVINMRLECSRVLYGRNTIIKIGRCADYHHRTRLEHSDETQLCSVHLKAVKNDSFEGRKHIYFIKQALLIPNKILLYHYLCI